MTYPLVLDLAAGGVPVAVTCRVPGFSKQAIYAWQKNLDVHADDPGFGYRFIADELPARGIIAEENRVARLCSQQRIWSAFAKKRRPEPLCNAIALDRHRALAQYASRDCAALARDNGVMLSVSWKGDAGTTPSRRASSPPSSASSSMTGPGRPGQACTGLSSITLRLVQHPPAPQLSRLSQPRRIRVNPPHRRPKAA